MDVIANNIANIETTRTKAGGPFKAARVVFAPVEDRKSQAVFASQLEKAHNSFKGGLQVVGIVEDQTPPKQVYDPRHPDADENGYVAYPNVDLVTEMTDMLSATRAYQASVTAINAIKTMANKALELGRG